MERESSVYVIPILVIFWPFVVEVIGVLEDRSVHSRNSKVLKEKNQRKMSLYTTVHI